MKSKHENFKEMVKENKKTLIDGGIGKYAVRSYIYTNRVPKEDQAKKISAILGVPLSQIPYYRVEHV